jgi:hypothetical protein
VDQTVAIVVPIDNRNEVLAKNQPKKVQDLKEWNVWDCHQRKSSLEMLWFLILSAFTLIAN